MDKTEDKLKNTYDLEMERRLLGKMFLGPEIIDEVIELLRPEHFYQKANRKIFESVLELKKEVSEIDKFLVYEHLKKTGANVSLDYLNNIDNNVQSSVDFKYPMFMIYRKFLSRQILSILDSKRNEILEASKDVEDVLYGLNSAISNIDTQIIRERDRTVWEDLDECINDIIHRRDNVNDSVLLSSSFPSLNNITGGIKQTNLIALTGKEKSAKTTFAETLLLDFGINRKTPSAYFSFEVSKAELMWKALSLESGVSYSKLRNPKGTNASDSLDNNDVENLKQISIKKFRNSKIFFIDGVLNEQQVKLKIAALKREHNLGFAVIDYIGLCPISIKHSTRELEIAYLSRFFKMAAKELEVPILVLSQQNREGDIAESKGLERDSDFVFTIEKPVDSGSSLLQLNGRNYTLNENNYVLTLKRSRHGKQGYNFLLQYQDNKLSEVDLLRYLEF